MNPKFLLFILMSLIWGGNWAAVKVGVTAVPPIFLAAIRNGLAGVVLAVVVREFHAPFGDPGPGRAWDTLSPH